MVNAVAVAVAAFDLDYWSRCNPVQVAAAQRLVVVARDTNHPMGDTLVDQQDAVGMALAAVVDEVVIAVPNAPNPFDHQKQLDTQLGCRTRATVDSDSNCDHAPTN